MKKKTYMAPAIDVIEIGTTQMIASSPTLDENGTGFEIDGPLENGLQSSFKAPKRTLWDDEEDEL